MNEVQNAADQSTEAGFTLVEVLVALTLTMLILSLISGVIGSGLKVWKASKELDRETQIHAVRNFLRERLAAMAPARARDSDGNLHVVFFGSEQRLEFASMMPEGHLKAGLYKVSLYLAPEGGSDALPRASALAISMAPLQGIDVSLLAQSHPITLLTQVETFGMQYFGQRAEHEQAGWHRSWESATAVPALVQIRIGMKKDDSSPSGSFTIETKLR